MPEKVINNTEGITSELVSEGHGHDRSMAKLSVAVLGGIFIVNSFILKQLMPSQPAVSDISGLIGALIVSFPILVTAVKDIFKVRKITMNILVALAIFAAFVSQNFQEAGIIAFFLLITIIIESRTASGAQRSIEDLIKLTPTTAHKLVDGEEVECEVKDLTINDIIRVRPGDNFPIDGEIAKGETIVNQASITGESIPVDKSAGDEIFAGTQNLTGSVDVKVTKVGQDTTLGRVKDMIMNAENSKTPVVRLIDTCLPFYTMIVLMIAIITFFIFQNLQMVIAILVVACPCSILLATPTANVAAVAAAARLGIFIKNISDLQLASRVTTFVFDKTGTLTDGILSVAKLKPIGRISPAQLLKAAATAEAHSNHPTAVAVRNLAAEAGLEIDEIDSFEEVHGKGVIAHIENKKIYVGRLKWLQSIGFTVEGEEEHNNESEGMSVMFVAENDKIIGWIGLKDKLRKESAKIISDLRKFGVKHCAMVTGDRNTVAVNVSNKLDLDNFESECLPEDKVDYVEKMKKSSMVAVVGDGVNDAPALAAGNLGIAMGAIGSDIAINSASIALMTNDLKRIPVLVELSRSTKTTLFLNLLIGFSFVFGGVLLALFDQLSPIMAAVFHTTSTALVIFNSAGLVRTGEELTLEENKNITTVGAESADAGATASI